MRKKKFFGKNGVSLSLRLSPAQPLGWQSPPMAHQKRFGRQPRTGRNLRQ